MPPPTRLGNDLVENRARVCALRHTLAVSSRVRDLVGLARKNSPAEFSKLMGGPLLVGPRMTDEERADWSFSTRVTTSGPGGPPIEGFPDHEVYVVKPARRRLFKKAVTVGRASSNDVWIEDDSISKVHAEITFEADEMFIADLGSANGTGIDGHPLQSFTRRRRSLLTIMHANARVARFRKRCSQAAGQGRPALPVLRR